MPINAIGNTGSTPPTAPTAASTLDQTEFLRLFVRTLQSQDPLNAMDTGQMLTQMAQFASLEQSRQTNESLQTIAFSGATDQAVGMMGRKVEVVMDNGTFVGKVTAVDFTPAGPLLTVLDESDPQNPVYQPRVSLSQVRRVLQ